MFVPSVYIFQFYSRLAAKQGESYRVSVYIFQFYSRLANELLESIKQKIDESFNSIVDQRGKADGNKKKSGKTFNSIVDQPVRGTLHNVSQSLYFQFYSRLAQQLNRMDPQEVLNFQFYSRLAVVE